MPTVTECRLVVAFKEGREKREDYGVTRGYFLDLIVLFIIFIHKNTVIMFS